MAIDVVLYRLNSYKKRNKKLYNDEPIPKPIFIFTSIKVSESFS
jgi:hypothetical protein